MWQDFRVRHCKLPLYSDGLHPYLPSLQCSAANRCGGEDSTSDKMSSDGLNSFSQACTIFTVQNYGAGQLKRCKKVLILCIIEDAIVTTGAIFLILLSVT